MTTLSQPSAGGLRPSLGRAIAGIATGARTLVDADDLGLALAARLAAAAWVTDGVHVATHWVGREGTAQLALSAELPVPPDLAWSMLLAIIRPGHRAGTSVILGTQAEGPADLAAAARSAALERASGHGGRAVVFPGATTVPLHCTVAELLAGTAIDMVRLADGRPADRFAEVVPTTHLRPRWVEGLLELTVRPFADQLEPVDLPTRAGRAAGSRYS